MDDNQPSEEDILQNQPASASRSFFKRRRVIGLSVALLIMVLGIGVYFLLTPRGNVLTALLPETNYSVPDRAVFVSPKGSDTAAGSVNAPVKSLKTAFSKVASGGTIVLRAGSYYDVALGSINKKFTLQPYPKEKVWIKGSKLVASWKKDGSVWRADNWTTKFCRTCVDKAALNSGYPLAGSPDQVFMDDKLLSEVASKSQVTAGKFYVDYSQKAIFVGSDPTNKRMEASSQWRALQLSAGAAGSTIRGIGFAQYAPHWKEDQLAMVISDAPNVTFENNVFTQSAGTALGIFKGGNKLTSNVVSDNGYRGVSANRAHNFIAKNNTFDNNNTSNFAFSGCGAYCTVAGIKITHTDGIEFTDNYVRGNTGAGFWCDLGCENTIVARNMVANNKGNGIFYEVSTKGTLTSNVIVGNGLGMKIAGSDYLKIYNNTFAKNASTIGMYDDARPASQDGYSQEKKYSWNTTNVELRNNLFTMSSDSAKPMYDTNTGQVNSRQMIKSMDHNAWYRAKSSSPSTLIKWCPPTCKNYKNLNEFKSATKLEEASIAVDDKANPFFVDEAKGNYSLKSNSSAVKAGATLPADVAKAIGVSTGPVNIGALKWRGQNDLASNPTQPESPASHQPANKVVEPPKTNPNNGVNEAPNNPEPPTPSAPEDPAPRTEMVTINSSDDATIKEGSPDAKFGNAASLRADNSPREDFLLKFNIGNLNGKSIAKAVIKLRAVDSGDSGLELFQAKHNNWNQGSVTWKSAPWLNRPPVATLGPVAKGSTYELNVTRAISKEGTYSFRGLLTKPSGVEFSSSEGSVKPQLVLELQ